MAPAWDNVSLPAGPTPASYAAPLLNFSWIGDLAKNYYEGSQQARTLALQNAFKDGLPTLKDQQGNVVVDPQTGQPMFDTAAIAQRAAKLGGLEGAAPFLQLQLKGQALGGVANAIGGGGGNAITPPNNSMQPTTAPYPAHGVPSAAGGQTSAPAQQPAQTDTLTNFVRSQVTDPDRADSVIKLAKASGIDEFAPIDPNSANGQRVARWVAAANGNVTPTGGTAGQPAPQTFAQRADNAFGPLQAPQPTAQGMDLATADALSQRAANIRSAALRAEAFQPGLGKAGLDQAQALDDRAKQIREVFARNSELPPDVKNYQVGKLPGETLPEFQARTAGLTEANKTDVDTFNKQTTAIQTLANASFNGLQKATLAKQLTLDPNFYSGPLSKESQTYNQFKSVFGSAPTSAMPQEAFNKVVNDMLVEQVRSMGGSGVGRVLQSEVNAMRQSIASMGITPASNRALLEIVSRVYSQQQDLAKITQSIPRNANGQMTNQLNQRLAQYFQGKPLFSAVEIQHPALLAAPDAPPQSAQWTPQQARTWAQGVGLKVGDPIRINGQIMAVP